MKISVAQIKGSRYAKELRRLFVFAHSLLPFLSCISVLTGWYFLSNKIMPGLFPQLTPLPLALMAFSLVGLIELTKYFLSPLLTKGIWHKDWLLSVILAPLLLTFYFMSVNLSISGVNEFYQDQDNSQQILQTHFSHKRDSLEKTYASQLVQKDSALSILEQKSGGSEVLKRLDRINRKIARASEDHRSASNDSIQHILKERLSLLSQERTLVMASGGASVSQAKRMEILYAERAEIQAKKTDALTQLEKDKTQALNGNTTSGNIIQSYILYISLGIEFLILVSLTYIQWYKLKVSEETFTDKVETQELSVNTSELKYLNGTVSALRDNGDSHKEKNLPNGTKKAASKKRKATPSNKNGASRKRLSKEEKVAIKKAFAGIEEGNVDTLAGLLAEQYQVSRRTIYRAKGEG